MTTPHPVTPPTVAAITTKIPYGGTTVSFTVAPVSGPVGTPVGVSGHGFIGTAGEDARDHAYFFVLVGHIGPTCELVAPSVRPQISVDAAGDMTGSFVIPSRASCFQQAGSDRPLPAGSYYISLGAHSDFMAEFIVTPR